MILDNGSIPAEREAKPASVAKDGRGIGEKQAYANVWKISVLLIILITAFLGSFLLGRFPVAPDMVIAILCSKLLALPQAGTDTMETIVLDIRLPRIMAALLVGSALAVSGAAYQNLFRNPLVSPSILGASWGAAFGAVLGMVFHLSWIWVESLAFVFGLAAVVSALTISSWFGNKSTISLVLAGIVVSAFFQALVSVLKYLADPMNTLPEISFWLMGGAFQGYQSRRHIALYSHPAADGSAIFHAMAD